MASVGQGRSGRVARCSPVDVAIAPQSPRRRTPVVGTHAGPVALLRSTHCRVSAPHDTAGAWRKRRLRTAPVGRNAAHQPSREGAATSRRDLIRTSDSGVDEKKMALAWTRCEPRRRDSDRFHLWFSRVELTSLDETVAHSSVGCAPVVPFMQRSNRVPLTRCFSSIKHLHHCRRGDAANARDALSTLVL